MGAFLLKLSELVDAHFQGPFSLPPLTPSEQDCWDTSLQSQEGGSLPRLGGAAVFLWGSAGAEQLSGGFLSSEPSLSCSFDRRGQVVGVFVSIRWPFWAASFFSFGLGHVRLEEMGNPSLALLPPGVPHQPAFLPPILESFVGVRGNARGF